MAFTVTDAPTVPTSAPSAVTTRFVRKTDPAEALVTSWRAISDTEHVVTAAWPRTHSFYAPDTDFYSPLLYTESIRQGLAVLSHTAFGIPLDHRLGWESFSSTAVPAALRRTSEPVAVDLQITHTSVTRRRLGSTHLTAHIEATRDGEHLGTADIRYVTHPGAIYNRLRGRYADAKQAFATALPHGPAVSPSLVGRDDERDVVLSPTEDPYRWQLRADISHTVLFDHPHDHIPGMVILEAFSQATQLLSAPYRTLPVAFDTTFRRYVELDQPCWITAEPLTESDVRLTAVQGQHLVASTIVTTEPVSGR
ncbi:ScbA/BarX family gamma-butyrolactone biosynthesis protein [Streptomyces sp. B-S-A8]|uniref:ScbA/BarX family gamma-butyrolactone biosynthesis protein n=1 Tax=Streptomyces solicavernae TaxID=3043614 RepID=A0ABT6RZX7_9ACTN|nr:ScbA/BarX family gamma-butyrolactone biosynthesis protein [Streptomyces sp. B-S-A8]MDI3389980.1 ScbA/BarX family gamma-butyrolactone biosynthesis protein [Streptomyces sp. B-S-A8]